VTPSRPRRSSAAHPLHLQRHNLFVRYRFGTTFPGDVSGKSAVTNPALGYLPMYDPDLFELFNPIQRELAARAITRDGTTLPDILCLQEVESLIALRAFNERHLKGAYPHALLVDSRDFRQIDVAILSRLPILDVQTHVDDLDPLPDDPTRPWLFSRDCLEVEVALGNRRLSIFVNHLKSKFAKTAEERASGDASELGGPKPFAISSTGASRVRAFSRAWFCVVGDLNDEPQSAPDRRPEDDCWTHWYRSENGVSPRRGKNLGCAAGARQAVELRVSTERPSLVFPFLLSVTGLAFFR
jgi:endonuclease/exonuclease/phosphatase family metal-dependent hydrolase